MPFSFSRETNLEAHLLESIVNSIGPGLMVFGQDALCSPIYSKSCLTLLEMVPAGLSIDRVLRVDAAEKDQFLLSFGLIFDPTKPAPFEIFSAVAPKTLNHSNGSIIQLNYKPILSPENVIVQVLVIATDATEQFKAQSLLDEMKAQQDFLDSSLRSRQFFGAYMRHAAAFSANLLVMDGPIDIEDILREVHILKSGAGLFKATPLVKALHAFETELKTYYRQIGEKIFDETIQKRFDQAILAKHARSIDAEVSAILTMFKNRFGIDVLQLEHEGEYNKKAIAEFADYLVQTGNMHLWREYMLRVCAQSLFAYLQNYNIHILDLADRFNKLVQPLQINGQDILLPLRPYRAFLESLMHIFRNIIDHGIETPRDRLARGKNEAGLVQINVHFVGSGDRARIRLEISDDGEGIDTNRLRAKLDAKYPLEHWPVRSDEDVLNAIFSRQLSTRDTVMPYSKQGVGMGAVAQEVLKLGGTLAVKSARSKGTTFAIDLPFLLDALEWDDGLAIQKDIDKDHKKLFDLFNALSHSLSSGDDNMHILATMRELSNYASYHFGREEKLMKEIRFPGFLAHQGQHALFANKITALYKKFEKEKANTAALEALEFIRDWLIYHIAKVDRAYMSYIKNPSRDLSSIH